MLDLIHRATGIDDRGGRHLTRGCYEGLVELAPHLDSRHGRPRCRSDAGGQRTNNTARTLGGIGNRRVSLRVNLIMRRPRHRARSRVSGWRALSHAAIVVVAVGVGSLALTGCGGSPKPSNAGIRAVVAFVGDSNISFGANSPVDDLTYGTDNDVYPGNHLDNNYVPVFIARGGSGIREPDCLSSQCSSDNFWSVKLAAAFTKVTPDAVVTDLGINDAASSGTSSTQGYADYGHKIDWFMNLLPNAPVFWTNLPCAIEPTVYQRGCQTIDNGLAGAARRWPNLVVLNWARVADSHPQWMLDDGTGYGVHYTQAGYSAWTALVVHALDRVFPT
jgi:GDSL-like Lipase/Acylhydrolase family